MRKTRTRHGLRIGGAGTLAVISCALALLAAQPSVRASTGGQTGAVVITTETASVSGSVCSPQTTASRRNSSQAKKSESFLAASHPLHILATMEIVKRWLGLRVRPVQMDVGGGWLCINEPLGFEIVVCPPYRVLAVESGGMTVERGFAIHHCLLAPPAV